MIQERCTLIVTASRRTDIPAFFSEWFINRIRAGYFCNWNPFNPTQLRQYSMAPHDVDAIVLVTKDPTPIISHLDELDSRGYKYCFQYTLNDYPALFEPHVPAVSDRVTSFKALSDRLGAGRITWRYDPIIISSLTPVDYHLRRFAALVKQLKGCTSSVIISFLDFYEKMRPALRRLQAGHEISFIDVASEEHLDSLHLLASGIGDIAAASGIRVQTCCETADLSAFGIRRGSCIDAQQIGDALGIVVEGKKARSQRPACLCDESIDMGAYNTCGFGCCYCYANGSQERCQANRLAHRAGGAYLLEPQARPKQLGLIHPPEKL